MGIKYANDIAEEIEERGEVQTPSGYVNGEAFEKWLRRKNNMEENPVFNIDYRKEAEKILNNLTVKTPPSKVRARLIVEIEGEFCDDEASEETLRYCVEQDLEDNGYNVIDVSIM